MVLSKHYFIRILDQYLIVLHFHYVPIKTEHINNYLKKVASYETHRCTRIIGQEME